MNDTASSGTMAVLEDFFATSPMAVALMRHITDNNQEVRAERIFINDALINLFGAPDRESFLSMPVANSWVDIDSLLAVNRRLKNGDGLVDHEVERKKVNGTVIWVSMTTQEIDVFGKKFTLIWHRDITARKAAEAELAESETPVPVARRQPNGIRDAIGRDGELVYESPSLVRRWGPTPPGYRAWDENDFSSIHHYQHRRLHPDDRTMALSAIVALLEDDSKDADEIVHRTLDSSGEAVWLETRLSKVNDARMPNAFLMLVSRDVTERKLAEAALARWQFAQHESELERLAFTDELTGLSNRKQFETTLDSIEQQSRRTGGVFALLYVDLDNFKGINDTFGHSAGDQVLRDVAATLKSRVRETDMVARWGGDEFVILLTNLQHSVLVSEVCEKLIAGVSALKAPSDVPISASIGVALYPADAQTIEELHQCADGALYEAKTAGKNQFKTYSTALQTEIARRRHLKSNLARAVNEQSLRLHFQPIVDLRSQTVTGVEALIRWDCDGEAISPAAFIH